MTHQECRGAELKHVNVIAYHVYVSGLSYKKATHDKIDDSMLKIRVINHVV